MLIGAYHVNIFVLRKILDFVVLRNSIKILNYRGNFFSRVNISFSVPGNRIVYAYSATNRVEYIILL